MSGRLRPGVALLALDVVAVLVFAAVGRRMHASDVTVLGVLEVAGPFLAGVVVGWLLTRAWRRPMALRHVGVGVWLAVLVVGVLGRNMLGGGTPVAFVVVTAAVLAALLLGWRAGAWAVAWAVAWTSTRRA